MKLVACAGLIKLNLRILFCSIFINAVIFWSPSIGIDIRHLLRRTLVLLNVGRAL